MIFYIFTSRFYLHHLLLAWGHVLNQWVSKKMVYLQNPQQSQCIILQTKWVSWPILWSINLIFILISLALKTFAIYLCSTSSPNYPPTLLCRNLCLAHLLLGRFPGCQPLHNRVDVNFFSYEAIHDMELKFVFDHWEELKRSRALCDIVREVTHGDLPHALDVLTTILTH